VCECLWRSFYEVETTEATHEAEPTYGDFGGEPAAEEAQYMYEAPAPVEEAPVYGGGFDAAASSGIPAVEEENELTRFMREFEEKIAEKAADQEKVAIECKAKAESDMEQFLAERARLKESKQQANRVREQAALEKLAADLQSENPWERVVTLVDLEANRKQKLAALNPKKDKKEPEPTPKPAAKKPADDGEDISRMRQLFVQLKAEPLDKTRGIAAH
jgi:ElaB/YqjD/DUF883 family membrane-anchored ribosome-binding protein